MDGLDPYLVLGMTNCAACAQRVDINYQMCATPFLVLRKIILHMHNIFISTPKINFGSQL